MTPAERLTAAADRLDDLDAEACTCRQDYPGGYGHTPVCALYGGRSELERVATGVMPLVGAWLRWEARCAAVPAHSRRALAVADQILNGTT